MLLPKKILASALAGALLMTTVACGGGNTTSAAPATDTSTSATASTAVSTAPTDTNGEKPYIAIVSKGFQHQFWQVVKQGADQAAIDYNVDISFNGPPAESDIAIQVDMLKAELDKNPNAIALAALDTESVLEQLKSCQDKGIPVIGFDSGVPNAPEGSIYATASTDNYAAAGIAADHLYNNADFKAKLDAATPDAPIYVGVLSQDATSESVVSRTTGFVETLTGLVGDADVEVTGHDTYKKAAANGGKLIINVVVPATSSAADMKSSAESMLTTGNLTAIFGSNENAAGGILSATNDGNDFNKESGKYKDIIAIGFDAGRTQRVAVENGWFYGSITQDPYSIGYKAVELAVQAIDGEPGTGEIMDTGAKWYDSTNVNDADITDLVYE